MPSIDKVGGGITITFAPKNDDVREVLVELKKSKKVKLTDYICEAIRFYEANKDKMNNDKGDLAEIIKEEVSKQIKDEIEKIEVSKQIKDEIEKILEEKKLSLIEQKTKSLEDDVDHVDITED